LKIFVYHNHIQHLSLRSALHFDPAPAQPRFIRFTTELATFWQPRWPAGLSAATGENATSTKTARTNNFCML